MPFRFLIPLWLLAGASPLGAQAPAPADSARAGAPTSGLPKAVPAERAKREQALREFLQKLTPEKRQRVLAAMRKVWDDQEVRAAREELRAAAETYKRTMREAIDETDPEVRETVRPLLDRLGRDGLNPSQWAAAASGPPRLQRLFGLNAERLESLAPDDRRLLASMRDRVAADDRVKAALAKVEQAPDLPGGRGPALRELRRTARAVAAELEPRLAALFERLGDAAPEGGSK